MADRALSGQWTFCGHDTNLSGRSRLDTVDTLPLGSVHLSTPVSGRLEEGINPMIDPRLAAILKRNPELRGPFEFVARARADRRHALLDHLVATCASAVRGQAEELRRLYLEIEAGMTSGRGAQRLAAVRARMQTMIAYRNRMDGDPDFDEAMANEVQTKLQNLWS